MGSIDSLLAIMPLVASLACAFSSGFCLLKAVALQRRSIEHRSSLGAHESKGRRQGRSASTATIGFIERLSRDLALSGKRGIVPPNLAKSDWFNSHALKAGLEGKADARGFREAQARLALLYGVVGLLVGSVFSIELAGVLAAVGFVIGMQLPAYAVKTQISIRAHETERHLPEMLEVVALGVRSGLSFDSSLHLYADHFDCNLSRDLANSQRQWSSGLTRREEALRKVAASYDSIVLSRVVETIIRSVRYGSTMAQSLEDDAAEARRAYKSRREERVAKAPIKMMIPTGTLILPAMLILVMGPVLLNLMGGEV